jgi:hypothetical protein
MLVIKSGDAIIVDCMEPPMRRAGLCRGAVLADAVAGEEGKMPAG